MKPNSLKRSTVNVMVEITWPAEWPQWDDLEQRDRNIIRYAIDLIDAVLEAAA